MSTTGQTRFYDHVNDAAYRILTEGEFPRSMIDNSEAIAREVEAVATGDDFDVLDLNDPIDVAASDVRHVLTNAQPGETVTVTVTTTPGRAVELTRTRTTTARYGA